MMNQLCMEEVEEFLKFPVGTFANEKGLAKFALAHEMGHAFDAGNSKVLENFKLHVDSPGAFIGDFNKNPIIRRHAFVILSDREIFADVLASHLYKPDWLNQQMSDWVEDEMPKVLQ